MPQLNPVIPNPKEFDKSISLQTGRVFFIDDFSDFTPRLFYKFIHEGFLPVYRVKSESGFGFEYAIDLLYSDESTGDYYIVVSPDDDPVRFNAADYDSPYVKATSGFSNDGVFRIRQAIPVV